MAKKRRKKAETPKTPETGKVRAAWERWQLGGASGPAVASLFHRLLALVQVIATGSLLVQIEVLIGHRGLMPLAPFLERVRDLNVGVLEFPSLHRLGASDAALRGWLWLGMALSLVAFVGVLPRLCFFLNLVVYVRHRQVAVALARLARR